jgi:hypothetical protein
MHETVLTHPRNRVLVETLTAAELTKFPTFSVTLRFIAMFTTATGFCPEPE